MKHGLRNALIPLTTVVALGIGTLFGGAVITEQVFVWHGMGEYLLQNGIGQNDINVVLGWLLVSACSSCCSTSSPTSSTRSSTRASVWPDRPRRPMTTTQAATEAAAANTPGGDVEREFTVQARSQRQQIIRRFLHNKVGMTGLVVFLLLLAFGFLGPLVYGTDYASQNSDAQSVPPGVDGYPLGSDAIGRDLLAGLMQGVQRSLFIVLLFIVIALPLGLFVGALAGYYGKWVDSVLMRLVDLILTVPLLSC